MRLLIGIICLSYLLLTVGCGSCSGNFKDKGPCYGNMLDITFEKFDPSQIDSVTLIHYTKGTNFGVARDTTKYGTWVNNGIAHLDANFIDNAVNDNYDVEIIIEGFKKVRISNITTGTKDYCYDETCLGCYHSGVYSCPIISYVQDGVSSSVVPAVITK